MVAFFDVDNTLIPGWSIEERFFLHLWSNGIIGFNEVFIGVIVVAIVGNAAEHSSAIFAALRNKMTLSMTITIESSKQVALFVAPFLVFLSLVIGPAPMSLVFKPDEMRASDSAGARPSSGPVIVLELLRSWLSFGIVTIQVAGMLAARFVRLLVVHRGRELPVINGLNGTAINRIGRDRSAPGYYG